MTVYLSLFLVEKGNGPQILPTTLTHHQGTGTAQHLGTKQASTRGLHQTSQSSTTKAPLF